MFFQVDRIHSYRSLHPCRCLIRLASPTHTPLIRLRSSLNHWAHHSLKIPLFILVLKRWSTNERRKSRSIPVYLPGLRSIGYRQLVQLGLGSRKGGKFTLYNAYKKYHLLLLILCAVVFSSFVHVCISLSKNCSFYISMLGIFGAIFQIGVYGNKYMYNPLIRWVHQ